MCSMRNIEERTYPIKLDSPYLRSQEEQGLEPLKPVFYEFSEKNMSFITNVKDPVMAISCASMIAINSLNKARNECFELDDENSKGLKIFAIEIGLFATAFLLAPIEIITRLALGIILAIPMTINYFTCDKGNREAFEAMSGLTFTGAFVACLALAHGAISTYTNLAYIDRKIDYEGQFRKFIGEF